MKYLGIALLAVTVLAGTALWIAPRPALLENVSFGRMVLDSKGQMLKISLSKDSKYRFRTGLDEISPEIVRAVIHYEDRYFYLHPGINPFSFARIIWQLVLPHGRKMGASTLTMQTARLRYNLKTSTIYGKLKQIWLALVLERHFSKDEILEAYFNLAPYGRNIEGIEAAARIYFNKSAGSLTGLEARALAVVPQNPVGRDPVNGPDWETARLRLEQSFCPAGQKPDKIPPLHTYGIAKLPFAAPHLSMELLGNADIRQDRINTWIETDLQKMLERCLASYIRKGQRYGIANAAAILVDAHNMHIVGLAGSAAFNDFSIAGQVDGTRAKRSPGSTLKPFIYALALEQGLIHPMTMLPDSPRSFGGYDPENFERDFRGPLPAHAALKSSRNLPAITLAGRLRQPGLFGFLRDCEVSLKFTQEHYGLALALGGAEVSMRELASLYGMLANEGIWQPLGLARENTEARTRRIISPQAARLALWMLERPEAAIMSRGNKIPLYYKTGTSNGLRDAWTAGLVGRYVLVVWVGNFDNSSNPNFIGAKTALPLFVELAGSLALQRSLRHEQKDMDACPGLNLARVCSSTGDMDRGRCGQTEETWLIAGVSPVKDTGILRPIIVDRASGKRACEPRYGETEEIWWEFWPSDMQKIFASAGIHKPDPPQWLAQCQKEDIRMARLPSAPRIMLPKNNMTYHRRQAAPHMELPLMAETDRDAGNIHWYADKIYLGSARPGEIFFWQTAFTGRLDIMAVDDAGRSSRQKCEIMALP